jgi:predicted amidohydrolase
MEEMKKMIKLATTCIVDSFTKEDNLKKYYTYIDQAKKAGAKLIVFPEQSLQGYLPSLATLSLDTFDYQYANAEKVPSGPSTQALLQKAKETGLYIIYGMTEQDEEDYNILYNTAVLIGPEGFVGKYRKVHQPADELHIYTPGNEFPVFDTAIGKIGMLICYDKAFPESTRELALQGAELLVMPTAWPLENPAQPLEQDVMMKFFNLYDQVRAVENQCFFISANHTGRLGDITYCGHSRITSPSGIELACTGNKEGIVFAEVDIRQEIIKGRTHGFIGLSLLRDRHPEAYHNLSCDCCE